MKSFKYSPHPNLPTQGGKGKSQKEILHCVQDDKQKTVILSRAKNLFSVFLSPLSGKVRMGGIGLNIFAVLVFSLSFSQCLMAGTLEEARALTEQGKGPEAIAKIENALRTGADQPALRAELIRAQLASGKPSTADELCEKFLKSYPKDPLIPEVLFLNATVKETNGKLAEALTAYRSIAEKNPAAKADALEAIIRIAPQASQDPKEEIRALENFIQAFPKDSRSQHFMQKLYSLCASRAGNDSKKAAETAVSYKALYPQDPANTGMHPFFHYLQLKDSRQAMETWEQETQSPMFAFDPILMEQAIPLFDSPERLEKVCQAYRTATGDPFFQVKIMELYAAKKNAAKTAEIANSLIQQYPNTGLARKASLVLADVNIKSGGEAESLIQGVLEKDPLNFQAWNLYSTLTEKKPESFLKFADQIMASVTSHPNRVLKSRVISYLAFRKVDIAASQKDGAGVIRHAKDFFEKTGSSDLEGGTVLSLALNASFDGAVPFDEILASAEKYLTRILPNSPAFERADRLSREISRAHAEESKKLSALLAKIRENPLQQEFRMVLQWKGRLKGRSDFSYEGLISKISALPNSDFDYQMVPFIADAMLQEGQADKAQGYLRDLNKKYPGDPSLLLLEAQACLRNEGSAKQAIPLIQEVAKLDYRPVDPMTAEETLLTAYGMNQMTSEAVAELKAFAARFPEGFAGRMALQERVAAAWASKGKKDEAKKLYEETMAATRYFNGDILVLQRAAQAIPDAAWLNPLLDQYLARPNRGPHQALALNIKGQLAFLDKNFSAASKILHEQASRPFETTLLPEELSINWVQKFGQSIVAQKTLSSEQIQTLVDIFKVHGNIGSLNEDALLAFARANRSIEFGQRLNDFIMPLDPDNESAFQMMLDFSNKLVAQSKEEFAGGLLSRVVTKFTQVDPRLRSQAEQAYLNVGGRGGETPVETVDASLPYADLLKAAQSLRSGDVETAWNAYSDNDKRFVDNSKYLPVDYLRFVVKRLITQGDDASRNSAERILRSWMVANDQARAIPDSEKAKTQHLLADVYYSSQRYDLARSEYTSLMNRFPKTPEATDANFRIAECYMEQKMYSEAAKILEKAEKSREKETASRAEFLLGVLAQQKGDVQEAKNRFKTVMEMDPGTDVANQLLYRLSELYGSESRYRDQLQLLYSVGVIGSAPKRWHMPGTPLSIVIQDTDLGVSRGESFVPVVVTTSSGDSETVRLESGTAGKGFFRADLATELGDPKKGDGKLQVNGRDLINYDYPESFKKGFSTIAKPLSDIQIASDADFFMSAREFQEEDIELRGPVEKNAKNKKDLKEDEFEVRVEHRKGNEVKPGNNIYVQVKDSDRDISGAADTVKVLVETSSQRHITTTLKETGPHTGIFKGTLKTKEVAPTAPATEIAATEETLGLLPGDTVTAKYDDEFNLVTPGKTRTLSQKVLATYFNGTMEVVANYFLESANNKDRVPKPFLKTVRRVDLEDRIVVRITDYDADTTDQRDKIQFKIKTASGQTVTREAMETEKYSGIFTKELDISTTKPDGIKLNPGEKVEISYLDEWNTDVKTPTDRVVGIERVDGAEPKISFIETRPSSPGRNGEETFEYIPAMEKKGAIKLVDFRAPLTFEIIDLAAAKDSFCEVEATLTTSSGTSAKVICPLSPGYRGVQSSRSSKRAKLDTALEEGRFVGQILLALGDQKSPSTMILSSGDRRNTVRRRLPQIRSGAEDAGVPVLNIGGRDLITVTYKWTSKVDKAVTKNFTDQARLSVSPTVGFYTANYEKPVKTAYLGDKLYLKVLDLTADLTPDRDSVSVEISSKNGEKFSAKLNETLAHSGEFSGSIPLVASEKPVASDARLESWFGDKLSVAYKPAGGIAAPPDVELEVVKGTNGELAAFEKKFGSEDVAVESQFRMAEAYFELFKKSRSLKKETEAQSALTEGLQILKELSKDYPSKQYEGRTFYLLGQFSQELKKYEEAVAYYRSILVKYPDHRLASDAQYKLGQCYEEKGEMDRACDEYVTLAYTYPDSPLVANVIVRLSEYFYNKKEFLTAADIARKFSERYPAHEWADRMAFRAAQCYFEAKQFEKAGQAFDSLVDLFPKSSFRPQALFWAGESYMNAPNLPLAYQRYKRTTWDYPESESARLARGRLVTPEMAKMSEN